MKILFNDVIETFNKVLIRETQNNNCFFKAVSEWHREMGPVKTGSTSIYVIRDGVSEKVIYTWYRDSIPAGQEDTLIYESQKKALLQFIDYFYKFLENECNR